MAAKNFLNMDTVSSSGSINNLTHLVNSATSRGSKTGQENLRSSHVQNINHQGGVGHPSKGWQDSYNWQTEHFTQKISPRVSENGTKFSSGFSHKLEAAEATIQELRQETLSAERRAQKLSIDVEILKKQLEIELKNVAEHQVEMSALEAECYSLKLKVEQSKDAKMASKKRENGEEYSWWEAEDSKRLIKALREEVRHEKELNVNLQLQLHKTQDSNANLVYAVTELEETLELRNSAIDRLAEVNDRLEEQVQMAQESNAGHSLTVTRLKETIQEMTRGADKITKDSLEILMASGKGHGEPEWTRKDTEWQQKFMFAKGGLMERIAEECRDPKQFTVKICDVEAEEGKRFNIDNATQQEQLSNVEESMQKQIEGEEDTKLGRGKSRSLKMECMQKIKEKDGAIKQLPSKLQCLGNRSNMTAQENPLVEDSSEQTLLNTIELLQRNMEEQETDCKELTDANIEPFQKLDIVSKDLESKMGVIIELEASLQGLPKFETGSSEQSLGNQMAEKQVLIDVLERQVRQLGRKNAYLEQQLEKSFMKPEDPQNMNVEWMNELYNRGTEFDAVQDEDTVAFVSVSEKSDECHLHVHEAVGDCAGSVSSQEVQLKLLGDKYSTLEEKCTHFQQKIFSFNEENTNIKEQLQQTTMLKDKLEHMVQVLQKENEELLLQLQCLMLENTRKNDQLINRDVEIQNLEIHIVTEKKLQAEVAECHAEIDKLIQELADSVASEKNLESKVIEAENERIMLETKIQELVEEQGISKSNIAALEFQLQDFSDEIKLLSKSKDEQNKVAMNLEKENTNLQEKLAEAQDKNKASRERLDEFVRQMTALTTTLDSQFMAKTALERRATQLGSDKAELETQVLVFKKENLQLSEIILGLEAQLGSLMGDREDHKLELEKTREQSLDYQSEKRRLEMVLQEVTSGYQEKLVELEQQKAHALRQADSFSQTRESLEQELDQHKSELSTLKFSYSDLEKVVKDLQLHQSLLEQQLQEATSVCTSSKEKCTALEAELAQQERECEHRELAFRAEIKSLIMMKDDYEHCANQVKETLTQIQEENAAAVGCLQIELQQFAEQLSCTIDEKEKALVEACELQARKSELEGFIECMQEKLQETSSILEEVTATGAHDKQKVLEFEGFVLELKRERQLMLEEQSRLKSQAMELAGAKVELDNVKTMLDLMNSEKVTVQLSLENLTAQCVSLQQEKMEVVDKLANLDMMVFEIDGLKQQNGVLEETLTQMQREKVIAVDCLQSELQQLAEQLSSTIDEKEKLASEARLEAFKLQAEKTELEDSHKHLQQRVKKMEESASVQRELELKIENMVREADASKKLHVDLTQSLKETCSTLEQMIAKAADDQEEIQKLQGIVLESEHERQFLLKEQNGVEDRASESVELELENMKARLDHISSEKAMVESSLENVSLQCASLTEENMTIFEKLTTEVNELKWQKGALEEKLIQMQGENFTAAGCLQSELQQLAEELSSTIDAKDKFASQALFAATELRAEKMELENSLKHMQEKVKEMEVSASLQWKSESKIEDTVIEADASKKLHMDLTQRLQETWTMLEQMTATVADDKDKIQNLERLVSELQHERQLLLTEQSLLRNQASELIAVKTELEIIKGRLDRVSSEKVMVESCLENMTDKCASLQQEKASIVEKLTTLEGMVFKVNELKRQKGDLEEKLVHFEPLLEAEEAERQNELLTLRRHVSQVECKLVEQENIREEFQRRAESFKQEHLQEDDALSRAEKELKVTETSLSGKSLERSDSKLGGASRSRVSKEIMELQERLRLLDSDAKAREEELNKSKRDFMEREAALYKKIERLELLNEDLEAARLIDSGADQLQKELIRLQNQNSFLSRREQELLSTMRTQEVLQKEVERLQEANDLLEARLSKIIDASKNPFLLEKIVNLETELAEAIEANNMYKIQLKSVFNKQQNVSMAALEDLGDLDQVINDLFQYRKKATQLEEELRGLHERYSLISLQLAEAEAERGELMMTVKNLKVTKKN